MNISYNRGGESSDTGENCNRMGDYPISKRSIHCGIRPIQINKKTQERVLNKGSFFFLAVRTSGRMKGVTLYDKAGPDISWKSYHGE